MKLDTTELPFSLDEPMSEFPLISIHLPELLRVYTEEMQDFYTSIDHHLQQLIDTQTNDHSDLGNWFFHEADYDFLFEETASEKIVNSLLNTYQEEATYATMET